MNAQFPECLQFLFEKARFKVAYGGRGSGKSWAMARALLIQAAQQPHRVLCAREVQKSIADSVHRLLSDQIVALGLQSFYSIFDHEIRGKNGSLFSFRGLSSTTIESVKSLAGYTICWVEEGQSVSKRSWDILIPTIRENGSEIWVSFNPELDTDDTYQRFVVNTPPNAIVRMVNYSDNPWFPDVLEQERQHCMLVNREDYDQIWEGKCRVALAGAIYASEVMSATLENRICNVPYDPRLKVHTIWDLGWNDAMTIGFVQRLRSEIRLIDYIEDSHKTLDWYAAELNKRNYNWGQDWLPHDGNHEDYKTGKSARQILASFGRKVRITPQIGIEPGIKAARMLFPQIYMDKNKCARLIECLKRYRRSINQKTLEPGAPLHDEFSHGADMFRYLGVAADQLHNEDEMRPIDDAGFNQFDSGFGTLG